jgi:DNA-binding PadR family transcriptional regulator
MHGHALRLLAEEEHIDEWTDFTVGAVYGVLKRLAAEGMIDELRVEREGNYPERAVYGITDAGLASLEEIRRATLDDLQFRSDPIDLALARLDDESVDNLGTIIGSRLDRLLALRAERVQHVSRIAQHLTVMEQHVMAHQEARMSAEIAWHQDLLAALPEITEDEKSRKGQFS